MAILHVPALLRPLCGGSDRLELAATTLEELLRAADERCPGLYQRVVVDGALRPELAVAIDGEMQSFALYEPLHPAADVSIVPAIGGG